MDLATYDVRQARASASLKWILSKAFNNRVPDNLREPYYRDNENQERLKPQIIIELGNATLYCQALSNLYTDPNYQSLNHWSILQTLTRKGVPVADVLDMPLTETILIQTNPLKINAHLSVIESIMALYAKEMSSNDRILTAIRRISNSQNAAPPAQSYEQNLLLWVSHCCAALKTRIANDRETELPHNLSEIAIPRDFKDLCDGVALCLLVSYYCPKAMPWSSIRFNSSPIVEDSVHNMLLIKSFCQNYLPYNVFHVKPEDVIYFGGPMKLNGIVMLADLFNLFEINVAKCVSYSGMENKEDILRRNIGTNEHGVIGRRGRTVQPVTPIPDLRTELPPTSSPTNRPPFQDFVVHKSKGITTLSSVHYQQAQQDAMTGKLRQLKDNSQVENKSDERADVAAGRPSHWDQNRRPSYAGRRSRRNSSSEDSQLTIENFGGSQDQLHNFGRYEREQPKIATTTTIETVQPARSSVADARGTLQLGYDTDSGSEKQDCETEKYRNRMPRSADSNSSCNGNVSKQPTQPVEKQYSEDKPNMPVDLSETSPTETVSQDLFDNNLRTFENASKLCAIRLKLEEKQRRIEQEKRKIELALLRHQEKTIQDDIDQAQWETWSNDSKRTSEMEPVEMDKYQQNIAAMNMNLQDIQQDIQRLATQQTHIQAQQVQAQQLMQAQQIANILNQQQIYGSQQHIPDSYPHRAMQQPQNYGSNPHLNNFNSRPPSRDPYQQVSNVPMQYINEQGQYLVNQSMRGSQNLMNPQQMPADLMYNNHPYGAGQMGGQHKHMQQNYMHPSSYSDDYVQKPDLERSGSLQSSPAYYLQDMSTPHAQRRTWSKSPYDHPGNPLVDVNAWQLQNTQTQAGNNHTQVIGYLQNGTPENQYSFPTHPSAQHPTYSGVQRQHSLTNLHGNHSPNLAKKSFYPPSKISADEMMAPQSICFIGDEDDVDEIERDIIESMQTACLQENTLRSAVNDKFNTMDDTEKNKLFLNNVNIQSGNLTYRIPSPSRPQLNAQSFQDPQDSEPTEKGFYISFDDDQPKRPKPPLRTKRSPKKENGNKADGDTLVRRESLSNTFSNGDKQYEMPSQHNIEPTNYAELNATYNKYVDPPFKPVQQFDKNQGQYDRRHLEDVTNQSQSTQPQSPTSNADLPNAKKESNHNGEPRNKALIIGKTVTDLDPESVDEMEKRKEKIMLLSLQRRQQQEEVKARKEIEAAKKREREREKEDERQRKKEEQMARRAAILEQHRLKKAIEEAEREGKTLDRSDSNVKQQAHPNASARLRSQKVIRRRPNTIHVDDGSLDIGDTSTLLNRSKKGSSVNLSGFGQTGSNTMKRDYYKGSQDSLATKELRAERDQSLSRISVAKGSTLYMRGRKSNSLMNLCETDSGLGRATPPRRAPSPGISGRHTLSASGPGSLPPGLISKRRGFDDGSSDVSSSQNSIMEYSGPKLYKQPAAKSNRGIILNAVEYCVFPGVVNRDAKQKVLEKIARSEAKHFLVLFRDAGCQFRALYSYMPETDQVSKLYGTGPSQVDEVMFDKFFKYNSGGKCFSQVHTKHLTVTIDAFTIHNSLWQGKKVHLPSKRDMALVI